MGNNGFIITHYVPGQLADGHAQDRFEGFDKSGVSFELSLEYFSSY